MTIDIEELVTFWPDDQHLNILLILPISSISSFFFSVVARYDDIDHISPIDNVTTISNICWLFCFWRYPQLILLLWRYSVIWGLLCVLMISLIVPFWGNSLLLRFDTICHRTTKQPLFQYWRESRHSAILMETGHYFNIDKKVDIHATAAVNSLFRF
jgi:hypothetical protein